MNKPRLTLHLVLLVSIVILGGVLRGIHFDLMEFKADEVKAIQLTEDWLGWGLLPRFGLVSGVGIRNPPAFIFILTPVVAITSFPLLIGFYVTVFNIAAIALIYRLGVIIGSPRAGRWASVFMAVHPWLILYSRKIWAQSLLPFFVVVFLIVIASSTVHRRARVIFWAGPLLSFIWQIHYSGYCVLVFFLIWILVQAGRKRINWPLALAGFAIGVILLLPYLVYSFQTDWVELRYSLLSGRRGGEGGLENLLHLGAVGVKAAFAGNFGYPFVTRFALPFHTPLVAARPWLPPLTIISTVLVLILAAAGIFHRGGLEKPGQRGERFALWLLVWVVIPPALYLAKGIRAPPHYFIVSLPAVVMLAGLGVDRLSFLLEEKGRGHAVSVFIPSALGVVVGGSGAAIWLSFILYINQTGGMEGDYGLAYRVQAAAARTLVEEKIPPAAIDAFLTRDNSIGIIYLLRYFSADRKFSPGRRARLIDSLMFPNRRCSSGEEILDAPDTGPLIICLSSD